METIALIATEVMREDNHKYINMGTYGLLDEIFERCEKRGVIKKKVEHPLNRQSYIMSQLRKSKQFRNTGYIDYPGYGRAYSRCAVLTPVGNKK